MTNNNLILNVYITMVGLGSITLESNNLSPNGQTFDSRIVKAPYSKFYINLRGNNINGRQIGLRRANVYYSWPNVVNKTDITVSFPVGAGYTTTTWSLPALTNYKSIAVLNQSLQDALAIAGMYLIDADGNFVYYATFTANETTYKVSLDLLKVPTSLPSGWSQPGNFVGYPTVSKTMKITIPTGSELAPMIGFDDNTTYDGGTTAIQYNSVYVPQLSKVSTIYVCLDVAHNSIPINSSTVIASFTSHNVPWGEMIAYEPSGGIDWFDIHTSSNVATLTLFDQNWNQLYVLDPASSIQLIVRDMPAL
jgi:hypothetical protein